MAYNYYYAVFARGDEAKAGGKKDGMLVGVVNPNDRPVTIQGMQKKAYCFMRRPIAEFAEMKALCKPNLKRNEDGTVPSGYRMRKRLINYTEVGNALSMSGLGDAVHSKNNVDIINGMSLPKSIFSTISSFS